MRILFISAWFPAGPVRYLSEAFEKLGHEAYRIGPCKNNHGSIEWGQYGARADIVLPNELREWNLPEYLDQATRNFGAPDLVMLGEENYQTEIVPLPNSVPSFLFSVDGWQSCYDRADVFQATINYTSNPLGVAPQPRETIDPRWRWLSTAWAPWAHPRINFSTELRRWDFCWHATMYGKRQEICDSLVKRELNVRSGFVTTPEYVQGNNFSLFTYHNCQKNGGEAKYRLYESMGMGCAVIADKSELIEQVTGRTCILSLCSTRTLMRAYGRT
jgi:hypothetical protein